MMLNWRSLQWVFMVIGLWVTPEVVAEDLDFATMRQNMVSEIEHDVRETTKWIGKTVLDERVMRAIGQVPRHEFVPESSQKQAYLNQPLPIGFGQTISQPYIVALMTDLLALPAKGKVLEIGTGSGYQAAVLAQIGFEVYSIEIVRPLAQQAKARFAKLGYAVTTKVADGYYGWPEQAPFDAIIVTAVTDYIPPPLIQQLALSGVMVVPIGNPFVTQELTLVKKQANGRVTTDQILPVRFVPLTGKH